MVPATYPIADQSSSIVRKNMARIKLFTVAGPLLCHAAQVNRVVQILENRYSWGIERPLVMLAVHSDDERIAAERFQSGVARDLAQYIIVREAIAPNRERKTEYTVVMQIWCAMRCGEASHMATVSGMIACRQEGRRQDAPQTASAKHWAMRACKRPRGG